MLLYRQFTENVQEIFQYFFPVKMLTCHSYRSYPFFFHGLYDCYNDYVDFKL